MNMNEQSENVPTPSNLANDHGSPRPIRAGEAYMEMIKDDPASQASLKRVQERFRLFAELYRKVMPADPSSVIKAAFRVLADSREQTEREIKQIWQEFATEQESYRSKWEQTYGAPYPESLEDFERWVYRLISAGHTLTVAQEMEFCDIFPRIEGYLLYLQDKHGLPTPAPDDGQSESSGSHKPGGFSKEDLCDEAGESTEHRLSSGTFIKIRNAAGICAAAPNGKGAKRKFSNHQIIKMILAAERLDGFACKRAASAWRELIGFSLENDTP